MSSYPAIRPARKRRSTLQTVFIIVGICAVIIGSFGWLIFHALSNSEAARMAMDKLENSSQAVQLLGAPIQRGWLVQGAINVNGSSGHADLSIPVSGSHTTGTLYVVAEKTVGQWSLARAELEIKGQPGRLKLVEPLSVPADPVH